MRIGKRIFSIPELKTRRAGAIIWQVVFIMTPACPKSTTPGRGWPGVNGCGRFLT
jgi:hypothetical protein